MRGVNLSARSTESSACYQGLGQHIGRRFLLRSGYFHFDTPAKLALAKVDKSNRNNLCALMDELIKGVLAIGSRLTPNHRPCLLCDRLTFTSHRLSSISISYC